MEVIVNKTMKTAELIDCRDKIDNFLFDVLALDNKFSIKVDPKDKYFKLENRYVNSLASIYVAQSKKLVTKTAKIVGTLGAKPVTKKAYEAAVDVASEIMGPEMAKKMEPEINYYVDKMWSFGKKEPVPVGIPVISGLKDTRSIDWLSKSDRFYVGRIFPDYEKEFVEALKKMTLESGLSATEVAKELQEKLGDKINQPLYAYERVVRTSATRVRNWSRIYSYDELGIVEVEIYAMMDERTCPICGEMDGKVFKVEGIINHIEKVMSADVEDLPDLNPFMTADQAKLDPETLLNDLGIALPPWHANCRCSHQITGAEVIPSEVDSSAVDAGEIFNMSDEDYQKLISKYQEGIE